MLEDQMRALFLSAIIPIGSFACTSDPSVDACSPDPGIVCRVAGTGAAGANNAAELAIESPLYSPMDVTVWTGADDFFIGDWTMPCLPACLSLWELLAWPGLNL